jgi:hypothetical protein
MAQMGAIAGIAGTGLQAFGSLRQGQAEAQAQEQQAIAAYKQGAMKRYQAWQMRNAADDAFGAAQREADTMGEYLLSAFQSGAAGSGFESGSGDIARQRGEIEGRLSQQRDLIQYAGKARKRALNQQAKLTKIEAKDLMKGAAPAHLDAAGSARTAGLIGGAGDLFSGISTMARYR